MSVWSSLKACYGFVLCLDAGGLADPKKLQELHSFFWQGRPRNRLGTSCKVMALFCLGRALDLGVLIVLSWLCDLQALEIQNQGFNYTMTSVSLRLIHKALGLKGLGGREYCFGSRSPVLYGRTGCQMVWCVVRKDFCALWAHGLEFITGHITHCSHSLKTNSFQVSPVA